MHVGIIGVGTQRRCQFNHRNTNSAWQRFFSPASSAAGSAAAQEQGSVTVTIDGATDTINTVTYKPPGEGPFPTLIFIMSRARTSYEPKVVARWFVGGAGR